MTQVGAEFKSSGITADTPKNVLFGAGTIHKGLKFLTDKWNFEESLICATSGGSSFSIVPEFVDIEIDGALVKVKGLKKKTGETATLTIHPAELKSDILKMALIANDTASTTATGYNEITSKVDIETGDYLENIAFVGKRLDGTPIIVILDNALCTSGLEVEATNKEGSFPELVFECHAELSPEADKLPYHIYYPSAAAAAASTASTDEDGK